MPLPGLLGLFVTCFVCGAVTARLSGRRLSSFVGMSIALAVGLLAPWIGEQLGLPAFNYWLLLVVLVAVSLVAGGLAAFLSRG